MLNDDLEIARKLLQGAWHPPRRRRISREALGPATFREIDGSELARQYATHRRIEGAPVTGSPRRDPRLAYPDDPPAFGGRMLNWARDLRGRRSED